MFPLREIILRLMENLNGSGMNMINIDGDLKTLMNFFNGIIKGYMDPSGWR